MDFGALRTLALDVNFSVHGVPATVTVEGLDPVETRVIWMTPVSEDVPIGADYTRREPIRIAALTRLDVPNVPRGTVIVAPEKGGGEDVSWVVDGHDRQEADHNRVYVKRQVCA